MLGGGGGGGGGLHSAKQYSPFILSLSFLPPCPHCVCVCVAGFCVCVFAEYVLMCVCVRVLQFVGRLEGECFPAAPSAREREWLRDLYWKPERHCFPSVCVWSVFAAIRTDPTQLTVRVCVVLSVFWL